MSRTITGSITWTNPIQSFGTGERVGIASDVAPQGLTNRTLFLSSSIEQLSASVQAQLFGSAERSVNVDITCGLHTPGETVNRVFAEGADSCHIELVTNSAKYAVPLYPPQGSTLTGIFISCVQGDVSGSMSAKAFREDINPFGTFTIQLGSTLTFAAGVGYRSGSIDLSSDNFIDHQAYRYWLQIIGGPGASTDYFNWARITFSDNHAVVER
jgi:hypothetical protein